MTIKNKETLIIIGAGPAALTAAIYASRTGISPLIVEGDKPGGQLMGTSYIENWPGIKRVLGPQLMMDMRAHAEGLGTRFMSGWITSSDFSKKPYTLTTNKGEVLSADAVIIATGSTPKKLGCPGEEEFWGKGVTTCAVCDGAFYRDGKVIIVGGGDTAMEDAHFMTKFTKDITVIHIREQLTASHAMQQPVLANSDIKIRYSSTVTEIIGENDHVTSVVVTNHLTGEKETLPANVVFIAVGLTPNSQPFKGQLELDKMGFIQTHQGTQTSVPGVFAAGDVVDYVYRQAITSAGTGCMAALDADRYLKSL